VNLKFNFKDKLFWINNFLPKELYKEMYVDFIKHRNKLGFEKSFVTWRTFKEEVKDMSDSFNQNTKTKLDYLNRYHTFLKHQPFVNLLNSKFDSHLRKYGYGQHLAWHDDDSPDKERTYAATYYFNKTWNESWGGELMFKDEIGAGFVPVIGNSLVIVKVGLKHKVNAILKKTHPRLSIQTWIY
jgi:Rps23 Pro-64 3,4-dihydroxylase Tpa1-like proline 4-hydroxylase